MFELRIVIGANFNRDIACRFELDCGLNAHTSMCRPTLAVQCSILTYPEWFFGGCSTCAVVLLQEDETARGSGRATANEGMSVSESLLTSAAVALKYLTVKKAQQAAAAVVVFSHVFAFHWTLLGMVFCIWVGIAVISRIWSAGFGKLSAASRALGKDLWSVTGKWKKQSAPNCKKD